MDYFYEAFWSFTDMVTMCVYRKESINIVQDSSFAFYRSYRIKSKCFKSLHKDLTLIVSNSIHKLC